MFDRRSRPRAALVVISDGADTASDRSLQQARDAVVKRDAFVYAIAIDAPGAAASTRVNPARAARPHQAHRRLYRSRPRGGGSRTGHRAHRRGAQFAVHHRLHAVAAARWHLARHPRAHQGPALPGSRAPGLRGGARATFDSGGRGGRCSDLPNLDVFRSRARPDRPSPLAAARTAVGDDAVVARPAVRALARGRARCCGRSSRRPSTSIDSTDRRGWASCRSRCGTSRRAGCRRCRGCRRFPS